MRFKHLKESSDGVPSFADQASGTLDKLGAGIKNLANLALFKIPSAYAAAARKVEADRLAALNATPEAPPAQPSGTTPNSRPAAVPTRNIPKASIAGVVAKVILSRMPEADDLPEFKNVSDESLSAVLTGISEMQTRMEAFLKRLPAIIRVSGLIQANEISEVVNRLDRQSTRITDSSDELLAASENGEQEAWELVLTNNDSTISSKAIVAVVKKISAKNSAANAAEIARNNGRKSRAEGLNLLNMVGAQHHILEDRLKELQKILAQANSSPITTEHLKNIRSLLKQL